MLMNSPIEATPFPINFVNIYESPFSIDLKRASAGKRNFEVMKGGGSSFKRKSALHAAMGEYFERVTQSSLSHRIKHKFLNAYNITKDAEIKIPLLDILLCNPMAFDPTFESSWNDSSGTAYQTNSMDLINSSFLEFIERQSLVYNWLTQSPGKRINLGKYADNTEINKVKICLKAYCNSIDIFEISISAKCCVILTIAYGETYKSIGLAADWNLERAITKSMKEAYQVISGFTPLHFNDIQSTELLLPISSNVLNKANIYYDKFMDLSIDAMLNKYSYLYKNKSEGCEILLKNIERPSDSNYLKILKCISEEICVELVVCFIPSIIDRIPGSVARVIGLGAFPHIKTDEINPSLYSIKGINQKTEFPNKGKLVPFA